MPYIAFRWMTLLSLCLSALLICGCQGCRDQPQKTAAEKKKEEEQKEQDKKQREKPPYETEPAVIYPGQYSDVVRTNRAKRGHWVTADFRITANQFDTQGELTATPFGASAAIPVESTNYYAVSSRPFSIPKGDLRNLETNVYIPRRDRSTSVSILFDLNRGSKLFSEVHGTPSLKANQFHLVVLTNRPDAYGYLNVIDSVNVPVSSEMGNALPPFYTVVRTRPTEEPIALPRQSLYWTTIAYLIWDDLEVDALDAEQQQALVDWIHFGGQLILSGPDCLDKLSDSFLADFLPATFDGTRNLLAADFEAVNNHWAVPMKNQPDRRRRISVNEKSPLLGVNFAVHPQAHFVTGTGELAIERQVGRGRIVATSFSLDDKPIIRWPSYRSFFNGSLLRRPGRQFGTTGDGTLSFAWTSDATSIFDPLISSTLRYLSRDLVNHDANAATRWTGTPADPGITPEQITGFSYGESSNLGIDPDFYQGGQFRPTFAPNRDHRNLDDTWHYGGYQHDEQSGTAGWNDNSGISAPARETLKLAAGITPPSSDFVLKMLAVYLLVLVPINWLVFWLMGRVEWAWIAAPFIAIAGAFMVARMASLDIGFVRSNSQVACIEIFADYPRAHVAQYSALYTSLSTGYDVDLDNPSAQSLPLGTPNQTWKEKTDSPVVFRRTIANRLEGLQVQSNTTGLLHAEMMFDMQGVFSLIEDDRQWRVANSTTIDLLDAAVVRGTQAADFEYAWIGQLENGNTSAELKFAAMGDMFQPWQESTELMSSIVAQRYWDQLSKSEAAIANENRLTFEVIRQSIPALDRRWDKFIELAVKRFPNVGRDELADTEVNRSVFEELIDALNPSDGVNVSRIFRSVVENLDLAPGEVRLIAITNQVIGSNKFTPQATQNQQQSLVVVHLRRPALPIASGDSNAIEDFFGRSDLDWLAEDAEDAEQRAVESDEPRDESDEPRDESDEPRDESDEPRDESDELQDESDEPRDESDG